ncbi:MAG: elongation factor P [Chloroflexi bacterium]|nr:elongation factor P [Chloroflexota bacterium]
MISSGELKKGMAIELGGELYQVVDFQHIKLGRGSAQMSLKLRNMRDGHTIERAFQSTEKFNKAYVEYRPVQYLYNDRDLYHFMDTKSYDQMALSKSQLGDAVKYLKEQMSLELLMHNDEPIGVELPTAVDLKIIETPPGFRGDTAASGTKPAKVETGITVNVPLFVNANDTIKVDTRTGQYLERV